MNLTRVNFKPALLCSAMSAPARTMTMSLDTPPSPEPAPAAQWTAFAGTRLLARGVPLEVALTVQATLQGDPGTSALTFDDQTGCLVDLDLRGSADDIAARLLPPPVSHAESMAADPQARSPGRPKLGVVAREVTLLPRHWDWLAAQPGGASVTLRKLVDTARAASTHQARIRQAQTSADRFMMAMAGNLPGYEDAARALYAGQRERFTELTQAWPTDLRDHSRRLAEPAFGPVPQPPDAAMPSKGQDPDRSSHC